MLPRIMHVSEMENYDYFSASTLVAVHARMELGRKREGLFIDEGTPVYLGNQLIEPMSATVTTKTSRVEDNIQGCTAIID